MFSVWTSYLFNFWIAMTVSATILIAVSIIGRKELLKQFNTNWKSITWGVVSAALLWIIFFFGEFFATLLFDFARSQVDSIYALKDNQNKLLISLGLIFIIGPSEEFFWRGYIQHSLIERVGEWKAFIITTLIYALVHIWSFNFVLIMAALICGVFWGLMYRYNKNMIPLIVSHALFDVVVFIVLPIM